MKAMGGNSDMKMTNKTLPDGSLVFTIGCMLISCVMTPVDAAAKPGRNWIAVADAELAVVLGTNPSPAEKRVTELLAERIKDRTGIALAASGDQAKLRLVIGTVATHDKIKTFAATRKEIAGLGPDGYCIAVDPQKPELYVIGQSDSGVVAGVGRLMREMRYQQGKLEL